MYVIASDDGSVMTICFNSAEFSFAIQDTVIDFKIARTALSLGTSVAIQFCDDNVKCIEKASSSTEKFPENIAVSADEMLEKI